MPHKWKAIGEPDAEGWFPVEDENGNRKQARRRPQPGSTPPTPAHAPVAPDSNAALVKAIEALVIQHGKTHDAFLAFIARPPQPITVNAPPVTVTTPPVTIAEGAVQLTVQAPPPTPITVNVPDQPPASVTVMPSTAEVRVEASAPVVIPPIVIPPAQVHMAAPSPMLIPDVAAAEAMARATEQHGDKLANIHADIAALSARQPADGIEAEKVNGKWVAKVIRRGA